MKKILLIEDDIDIKNIIEKYLASMSISVLYAGNGKDALDIIKTEGYPDLIISDIKMPVMDGLEFAKQMNELYGKRNIPLIFLTEKREVENIINGFDSGAVRYVTKPFQIGKLVRIINALLYSSDKPVIELIEHYDNFVSFKVTNNMECLKEIGHIVTDIISNIQDIQKNEKFRILDSVNNIILNIAACQEIIDEIEPVKDVTINYFYSDNTINMIIESPDNSILQKLKKYIENFFIDFKISLTENYIKITKALNTEKI